MNFSNKHLELVYVLPNSKNENYSTYCKVTTIFEKVIDCVPAFVIVINNQEFVFTFSDEPKKTFYIQQDGCLYFKLCDKKDVFFKVGNISKSVDSINEFLLHHPSYGFINEDEFGYFYTARNEGCVGLFNSKG